MVKKFVLTILMVTLITGGLYAQSLSQISYVIKKALPETQNIAVICLDTQQDKIKKEAQTAFLVTRIKVNVYPIKSMRDIPRAMSGITRMKHVATIVITNNSVLSQKSVKYLAQKLAGKGIPVISNRHSDTSKGALLSLVYKDDKIETHVSKVAAKALKITLSDEFLAECVVDVP
jgi:ABC-type uncharacterized transport system substrate-binding protein